MKFLELADKYLTEIREERPEQADVQSKSTPVSAKRETVEQHPGFADLDWPSILIDVAEATLGHDVSTYILRNQRRWPEWTRECEFFCESLREQSDLKADRLNYLTGWAVSAWIQYRDMEKTDSNEYQRQLRSIWHQAWAEGDRKSVV